MKMSVNIKTTTSLKKDNSSCPKLVKESCDTNLLDVKANLPKGILPNVMNNFLDKNLKTLLPTTVCPSVDIILSSVNEKLCLQDTRYPFGKSENLKYVMSNFPEVTADHFVYELNGTVQHGETIIESPEASELTEDNVFSTNPGDTSLILSADFLGRVFTALQKEGTFNVFVTESDLTDSGAMSPSMLTEIIPELPLDVQDYTINITVDEPTMVTLNPSKSLLHIYSTFEVSASFPESEPEALFVVQVHMNFRMQFSADDTNVHAVAALDRIFLTLFSTSVGAFEVQDLEDFFTSVIEQVYTPTINDNLQTVFPLPNIIKMMKIDFSEGHIEAVKDLLLISVSVCKA